MGIDDIGTENEGVVNFDTIDKHFYSAGHTHTRFEGCSWEERYRYLREMEKPEYVLDHICRLGYVKQRQAGIITQYYEEELAKTIEALGKKYSKRKINALKKRLGIKTRRRRKPLPREKGIIKKAQMDDETTYFLCPDPKCDLFSDPVKFYCESECPRIDELIKIIQCTNCKEPIELPGNHRSFQRVDHNCADGGRPSMFQRMSGKYRRIYERPK
jgi:hypothetical protein